MSHSTALQALLGILLAILLALDADSAEPFQPVLKAAPGFTVEHVYQVPSEIQGSWVSIAADPRGALYASDQYGPLYRVAIPATPNGSVAVLSLELPIGGAHGLAWIDDELYAVVGERDVCAPGLYRLRDTDGDGRLDQVRLLQSLDANGEHGLHAVAGSRDGKSLFVIAGNATPLPALARSRVPTLARNESLLTPLPAIIGSETRGQSRGGWICRTDREGAEWELMCIGLRNAYAIASDATGELFTADSDTEFEFGLPWYRPNRVLHCVSGADFGWRSGALKIPEEALDALPSVVALGAGSPTAVVFGTGAAFPSRYQSALFVADWSFGRLLAVHLRPQGASYSAEVEEIVTGTPLPIAAACVSPRDGALYFVTGGRKVQSHLYRMVWRGVNQR